MDEATDGKRPEMSDFSEPRMIMPVSETPAEAEDPRSRLCLPLVGDCRRVVAMLADAEAGHEAIVQQHRARFVELSQRERRVLDEINERLPESARVMPFSLLPPAVWETDLQPTLMSWGLVQVHPYLNLYLPETEAGNAMLYLPAVPRSCPDSYSEGALREARAIRARYRRARGPVPDAARASESELEDWLAEEESHRLNAVEEILALAEFLARRLLGNEIVERHEGLFGSVMKKAMGFPPGLLLQRV